MKIHKQNKDRESQMSMEVLPIPENEKYLSRHQLDKLSLDKESNRDKEEDFIRYGGRSPVALSINDDGEEDDEEVDAIKDEEVDAQLQFEHQEQKTRREEEENQEMLYIDQIDTQHQIFDGDEAMDMDQSTSQKKLIKLAMKKKRVQSFLSNDVE